VASGPRWCRSSDPLIRIAAIDDWGSTPGERAASYPCDGRIDDPDAILFRALDVAAPAALVYRWLCQLRVAPYSYDWIDNLGRRSPQQLIDGLDDLEVGQRACSIFEIVHFEAGRSVTLDARTAMFGRTTITYRTDPVGADTSRLVAKVVIGRRWGAAGRLYGWLLAAGDLVMMRKQLLRFKALAERDAAHD
jgi:hypothetical protein